MHMYLFARICKKYSRKVTEITKNADKVKSTSKTFSVNRSINRARSRDPSFETLETEAGANDNSACWRNVRGEPTTSDISPVIYTSRAR